MYNNIDKNLRQIAVSNLFHNGNSTEYVPPLFDMQENPDGKNGLYLAEIKQIGVAATRQEIWKWSRSFFCWRNEGVILTFLISDLPPLPDLGNCTNKPPIIYYILGMHAAEDSLGAKRQMNEYM